MRKHRVRTGGIVLLGVAAIVTSYFVGRARAGGIPAKNVMTFGGVLTDAAGSPLTGTKPIQVVFWDDATAGTQQCLTTSTPTPLTAGGAFQVALPDTCVTAVHAKSDLWTEVFVEGASIGRTKVGAVPYAIEASHAVSADTATTSDSAKNALTTVFGSELNASDAYGAGCLALDMFACTVATNRKCLVLGYKAGFFTGEWGSSGDGNTRTIACIK